MCKKFECFGLGCYFSENVFGMVAKLFYERVKKHQNKRDINYGRSLPTASFKTDSLKKMLSI